MASRTDLTAETYYLNGRYDRKITGNLIWFGLAGWQWVFLVEGFPAVVLGFVVLFFLVVVTLVPFAIGPDLALLKRDTDQLLTLATELKKSVDASREQTLSVDVVQKAEQIEKLAKSVKLKMRGD